MPYRQSGLLFISCVFEMVKLGAKIPRHAVNWVTRKLGCIARHEENPSEGVVKTYVERRIRRITTLGAKIARHAVT